MIDISIIVPIYKIESFLPKCIESLLAQTYKNLEIILVDDGSPDNCPEICDKYAEKFSNIKVIHQANAGLVRARQAGFKLARGEFIGYVDGDDWVECDMFEQLAEYQKKCAADIVIAGFTKDIGDFKTLHFNSIPEGIYAKKELQEFVYPNMLYDIKFNIPGIYTYVWNKLFRRSLVYKKQMNIAGEISIGEDAALVYPALLAADKICITKNHSYHYCQRANSMLKNSNDYSKLYMRMEKLYQNLKNDFDSCITQSRQRQILQDKLENYITLMLISMTGGAIFDLNNNVIFFGYENSISRGKIIIYGAGTVGQHLYGTLASARNKNLSIEKWIDPDYLIYRQHGLNVESVDSINNQDFDLIFIAMLDKVKSTNVREDLIKQGIPACKISEVKFAHTLETNKIFQMLEAD